MINVAAASLVDVIGEVITAGEWAAGGYRSVEHWVTVHGGLSSTRAKGLCALARRVDELPETVARFREGRLSEDQVVPIARHVPAEYEASVADLAEKTTPTQLARVVRSYRYDPDPPTPNNPDNDDDRERDRERERARRRSLAFGWDSSGNFTGAFTLPPDQGAVVQRALEASREILFNERSAAGTTSTEEAQITWADALVRMADVALGTDTTGRPAGDRYQVLLHLDLDQLDALTTGEQAALHLGPAISPAMARYMSCDASLRVILEKAGVAVNEGRRLRTVNRRQRRTVEHRDRGCRFPGCTNTTWIDIHHVIHWRDDGVTETWNLVALCPHHHRLHHQGEFGLTGNADQPDGLRFTNRHGHTIPNSPRPAPPPGPPPPGRWHHPTGERFQHRDIDLQKSA